MSISPDILYKNTWEKYLTQQRAWLDRSAWIRSLRIQVSTGIRYLHIVENSSVVDLQWSMLYWGSKYNFHTVCWDVVGCEWGKTSVYYGITHVCFNPGILPDFVGGPITNSYFYWCQNIAEKHKHNTWKQSR